MRETVVYAARIPDGEMSDVLYPPERQSEIDRLSNEKVKREKYFVWKLLEHAISETVGEPIENFAFERLPNRKWVSDRLCFSLSHTDGVVAVALSDKSVGVDVESVRAHREGLERSILTEKELKELSLTETDFFWDYIIKRWTQKESIFKAQEQKCFEPTKIEASEHCVKTETLELENERFMLSVCAHDADAAKFIIYNFDK